ncbi:MAG TPA: hypothetical protein VGD91_19475 [Trebonia sp.]
MAEEITYYAIVDDRSSRERPAGVLRRIRHDGGERDETFGTDLRWAPSSLLYEYEHGELGNKFIPIAEDEASQIVAHLRQAASPVEPD